MEAINQFETFIRKWYPAASVVFYDVVKQEEGAPNRLYDVLVDIGDRRHYLQMSEDFMSGLPAKDIKELTIEPAKIKWT